MLLCKLKPLNFPHVALRGQDGSKQEVISLSDAGYAPLPSYQRTAVDKAEWSEGKMMCSKTRHLISYSWLSHWPFTQLEQKQMQAFVTLLYLVYLAWTETFQLKRAQQIHVTTSGTKSVVFFGTSIVTNRKSAVKWMTRTSRVIRTMLNLSPNQLR